MANAQISPIQYRADIPALPFQAHLLDAEVPNVEVNMLERLRSLPVVPMWDVRSRQWAGAMQASLFHNIWDENGAELVYYWPASAGPLPVNSSAANPGLRVMVNGTDAANYTVRLVSV